MPGLQRASIGLVGAIVRARLAPAQATLTRTLGVRSLSLATDHYDLVVVGAGPAGYAAAMRANDFGKSVCLIERSENGLGGAEIFDGALSSKMMWELARETRLIQTAMPEFKHTFDSIKSKVRAVQRMKSDQLSDQVHRLKELGEPITLVKGTAEFIDPNTVTVEGHGLISGDNFVVATGSRPRVLPKYPVDGESILNSDHVMGMKDYPKSVVIVGAGVIGCEFATILSSFGQTKVHLLNERKERLLPMEDDDLASLVTQNLEAAGVSVHNDCNLTSATVLPNKAVEFTIGKSDGTEEKHIVEKAIFCVGRVPNTDNIGLDKTGVRMDERGVVEVVNNHCQTSVPHIFLAGDASPDIGLVNVGEMEGRHCAEYLYGSNDYICPVNYSNVASIMFLEPEVACIGMGEKEAERQGIPVRIGVYSFDLVNRAAISSGTRRRHGFVKILVTDDEKMQLLGMRALGLEASALIEAASLFIIENKSIRDYLKILHPHPAITEAVQECARMMLGCSVMKPTCHGDDVLRLETGDHKPVPTPRMRATTVPTYT